MVSLPSGRSVRYY